jgi:outer membrane protein OmpA-like peptidoglycan-associated protein
MRLPATRILTWSTALLLAISATPRLAHAQPVEDPGLSEAPPPPPPPAPKPSTPPPAPPPPAHPVSEPPPSTGRATAMPPMVTPPPPPPEVNETVDVQTQWVAPSGKEEQQALGDLYDRVAAPSMSGPVGLFHVLTGEAGKQNTFRVGLHLGFFQQDSFLISGNSMVKGDTNSRFTGDLTIDYTAWKYLEIYLALFNASNKNQRTDTGRTDPEVILSLGDLQLGLKGRYPVLPFMDLALHFGVKFLNSVNGISFNGDSTNVDIDAIASWDLRHATATSKVPLRFHLNFGYLYDNSLALLPTGQCAASTSNDPCIRSRVVETFAYGIGTSRLKLALATDAPISLPHSVGLQPFVEYHVDIPVGDGDQTVLRALRNDANVKGDRLNGQIIQYMTIGLRLRPVAGLVLDAGIDVGLQSPGFQFGPPVPAWNIVLGAAYAYEPGATAGKTKIITKTITREISRGAIEGKLRGVVRDAKTKKVIGSAVVKYLNRRMNSTLAGDDGTFLTPGIAPGPVSLEVSRDDFEPMRVETSVVARGETPLEVLLTPKPPAAGQVKARVSEQAGTPVGMATVRFTSQAGAVIDAESESAGSFNAKLPAGDYTMDVMADGFLSKQKQVTITPGQLQSVDVTLTRKPKQSHVTLTAKEIAIKGTIHFGTNNAVIQPDGEQLLDEVADALVRNPQIHKIRIEGHTDNRGTPEKNMTLSNDRAQSVMQYLIKQGIDPNRLEAQGFGATQPLVPNLTPANRTKNRRVTFRILDQAAGVMP